LRRQCWHSLSPWQWLFAVVQWQQVRSSGADRASWWHLIGIAAADLPRHPLRGKQRTERLQRPRPVLVGHRLPRARATHAMDAKNLVWWLTGVMILILALLVRRSRIAACEAIPAALGGCLLATHFLEQLLLHYQPGG
jgi:hypothetical protein